VVLSRETPIVIQHPNQLPRQQETMIKAWIPKLLLAGFVVLGLGLTLAIVLVVLAVMGYLGKAQVEVAGIVQPTATVTAHAVVIGNGTAGVVHNVLLSGGGKVRKRVGIVMCELVLAWSLVYLFGKFENREKSSEGSVAKGKGGSDNDRTTFYYATATSGS
jgi:Na+-transporting methylmalonyl-CoA/oxaloacetate decarboxylase gamma subunit